LFIALGLTLPIAFHLVGLGKVFLPMHLPVLIAGLFLGAEVGGIVGIITPALSALLTGMPPLTPPIAQMMVVELGIYGSACGYLRRRLEWGLWPSLICAMVAGRLAYGLLGASLLPLLGLQRISPLYPLTLGLVTSLPGVLVQLALVPPLVFLLEKASRFSILQREETASGHK